MLISTTSGKVLCRFSSDEGEAKSSLNEDEPNSVESVGFCDVSRFSSSCIISATTISLMYYVSKELELGFVFPSRSVIRLPWVAVAYLDGTLDIYDLNSQTLRHRWKNQAGLVCLRWVRAATLLGVCDLAGVVTLLDARTGLATAVCHGHQAEILDFQINRDASVVVTAGGDQKAKVFSLPSHILCFWMSVCKDRTCRQLGIVRVASSGSYVSPARDRTCRQLGIVRVASSGSYVSPARDRTCRQLGIVRVASSGLYVSPAQVHDLQSERALTLEMFWLMCDLMERLLLTLGFHSP
ncbi:hypothetical protein DNTS_003505 [Danionella cerebrum]|nr:hypothetical protein DNTS_003505 [Danionella translucida]